MNLADHRRFVAYDAWANREALESLARATSSPPPALRRMAHIVGAGALWLARVHGEKPPLAVWPDLTLEHCRSEAERLAAGWRAELAAFDEPSLVRRVSYANSKGEPWESTVGDILTHVTMHAAYHRGQVAADLRAAGVEPAYTDFIHAVRQGLID